MTEVVFRPAVPILLVRDVSRAAAFYVDRLGFARDFLYGDPPFYGSVSRGDARLHLRHVGRPNFADLAALEVSLIVATIEVSDVRALHDEFVVRGVEFAQGIESHEWGGTDFQVADPDGNRISFVTYAA
jgi:uncharacterized glyoxalase superfamily protein PhnB